MMEAHSEALTLEALQGWIGKKQTAEDVVSPRLVSEFRATLAPHFFEAPQGVAPLLIHWCLAPPAVALAGLGDDGHPAKGDFLPPVPLPRRMWAAGEVQFLDELRVGDTVKRISTITLVDRKAGRSGELWFVDVSHELSTPRGAAIKEVQSIVYRAVQGKAAAAPEPIVADGCLEIPIAFPSIRLFRYSALTFNGHRVHYDLPYSTKEEGYDGLVVHGPLQATLLAHVVSQSAGKSIKTFKFRGVSPLTASNATIRISQDAGNIRCCVCNIAGGMTMEASARLAD